MNDKSIREAVEMTENLIATENTFWEGGEEDDGVIALRKLLALATRYLELGGVVEKKEVGTYCFDNEQEVENRNYNLGRQDTLLAVMKRLEGIDFFEIVGKAVGGYHDPAVKILGNIIKDEVATAIREHIVKGEI